MWFNFYISTALEGIMDIVDVLVQFVPFLLFCCVFWCIRKHNSKLKIRHNVSSEQIESARMRCGWDDEDSITGFGIDSSGKSSYGVNIGGGFIS